jgi:hypothetical protein
MRCMHGAQECAGNVQQLCAQAYHDTDAWWAFVQCQNAAGRYAVGDAALARRCARAAGLDWEDAPAGRCAAIGRGSASAEGRARLRESVARTRAMGIEYVCARGPGAGRCSRAGAGRAARS